MIAFRTQPELAPLREPMIENIAEDLVYAPALSFPQHLSAQQAIDALRQARPDSDTIYYLYISDAEGRLAGAVSLRRLVTAAPDQKLGQLIDQPLLVLPADMPADQQAHRLTESGLLALPVVDHEGRLLGSIDAGDLLDAVEEEATEDMYRLAGVNKDEELERPISRAARDRVFWLIINMGTAFLAASVVSRFEAVIAQVAILAAFMPIVAGQGGNAGTQTLTFIVRSLALGEVSMTNARRTLLRELVIGICNGITIGLLVGVLGWLWQGNIALGVVVGVAMLGNLLMASLAGVIVPLSLKALRIDPALASSIFVTTVTDVCGFLFFLSLGAFALQMGYL
ncbi:MAG: magnesium transporter [Oscillochloris sp.]|nr:magnesium transporter [Oscillochloris sp.]